MSQQSRDDIPWVHTNEYNENFSRIPYEEQLKYAGQHIGVSLDGKTILAGGADAMEVESKLRRLAILRRQFPRQRRNRRTHDELPVSGGVRAQSAVCHPQAIIELRPVADLTLFPQFHHRPVHIRLLCLPQAGFRNDDPPAQRRYSLRVAWEWPDRIGHLDRRNAGAAARQAGPAPRYRVSSVPPQRATRPLPRPRRDGAALAVT